MGKLREKGEGEQSTKLIPFPAVVLNKGHCPSRRKCAWTYISMYMYTKSKCASCCAQAGVAKIKQLQPHTTYASIDSQVSEHFCHIQFYPSDIHPSNIWSPTLLTAGDNYLFSQSGVEAWHLQYVTSSRKSQSSFNCSDHCSG